jgi:acyl-CoA thioester hydrolase
MTPAAGKMLETYRGAVYPWHCDHMGHMNVMWYVGKFDEATWNLFSGIGLTPAFLREKHRAMAAVQQDISYRRELLSGDVVAVRSGMLEMREKAAKFVHEMRDAQSGAIAAVCILTAVHMDGKTRKSTAFPAEVIARGRGLLCSYEAGR